MKTRNKSLQHLLSEHRYVSFTELQSDLLNRKSKWPRNLQEIIGLLFHPTLLLREIRLKIVLSDAESKRIKHNKQFLKKELARQSVFFDTVEPYPLDIQQRKAVIADEDNCLVIAGAGSGKTSTIVAKIRYLTQIRHISTSKILPISFTKQSASDLKKRINVPGIEPMTFHKFGLNILEKATGMKPRIHDSEKNTLLFNKFLKQLSTEPDYLTLLNSFFLNHMKVPKSQFDFKSHGDYIQYLRDQDYTTFKRIKVQFQDKVTYKNEAVKSIEECVIANFLFFNQIEYSYEEPYDLNRLDFSRSGRYKPDFTIFSGSERIYLEHLGLNKSGNVPAFFAGPDETQTEASRRYRNQLAWKRKVHDRHKTKLIESYSYEFTDGTLLGNLSANLSEAGVKLRPLNEEQAWGVIQDSAKDQIDGFISLCETFLSLLKSNNYEVSDVRDISAKSADNHFLKKRTSLFLDLFEPLYQLYRQHLQETGTIDFNDMISLATETMKEGLYQHPYEYIIIDEFQDISFGRYKLLQALRQQNPTLKLYCVGDDWQSIYRFAGSDMSLFRDFEDYFGHTFKARIETTYRFNNPVMKISSDFILKNTNQTYKKLRSSDSKSATNFSFIRSETYDGDDTVALLSALNTLEGYGMSPTSSAYVIGRYNFDLRRIKNKDGEFAIDSLAGIVTHTFGAGVHAGKTIDIQFITAHKSKGLEADYVILINCNSGKYGFPSGRADDPVLHHVLSSVDQFENGEERRLFYVAVTRARKHVTFISSLSRKSKFIKELEDEQSKREFRCPRCGDGDMVLRTSKQSKFYGCSNFSYGCEYTTSTI